MEDESLQTKFRYFIYIAIYICIIYPVKRFFIPLYAWLVNNVYMFFFLISMTGWLYMYDFDIKRLSFELSDKLLKQNLDAIKWAFTPIITIFGYALSPLNILILLVILALVIKIVLMLRIFANRIKTIFGDVLVVVLWCYYTLFGDRENSVLLITKDEAKIKIYMYVILAIVIGVVVLVCVPDLWLGFFGIHMPNPYTDAYNVSNLTEV